MLLAIVFKPFALAWLFLGNLYQVTVLAIQTLLNLAVLSSSMTTPGPRARFLWETINTALPVELTRQLRPQS